MHTRLTLSLNHRLLAALQWGVAWWLFRDDDGLLRKSDVR
jgi:hypothetical protein